MNTTTSFRGGPEGGQIPHASVKKGLFWTIVGLLVFGILAIMAAGTVILIVTLSARSAGGESPKSAPTTAVPVVSKRSAIACWVTDETRFALTKEWSPAFPSSPTKWLRSQTLTPGVRCQMRLNGDDSLIFPISAVGELEPGTEIPRGIQVSYAQYSVRPSESEDSANFMVYYTDQ